MRTIKFRGKRYGDGAWAYGNLYQGTKEGEQYSIILDDAGYDLAPKDDRNLAIAFAENEVNVVLPATVGQFTGLLDKNGKEIYEGDVLSVLYNISLDRENVCVVYGGAGELTPGFYFSDDGTNDIYHTWNFRDFINDGEIIGNIHDNPELLKQND